MIKRKLAVNLTARPLTIKRVPIAQVEPWAKNPRGIKTADFERLKKQIAKFGVYKPLVVYRDGERYVVLGGNMRLRALKELGVREVEVSIVEAKTEVRRIEIALSDNDRAGFYEEQALAELVYPHIEGLDLNEFKVDLAEPLDLRAVVEGIGPSLDGTDSDTEKGGPVTTCPKCGYEWQS